MLSYVHQSFLPYNIKPFFNACAANSHGGAIILQKSVDSYFALVYSETQI